MLWLEGSGYSAGLQIRLFGLFVTILHRESLSDCSNVKDCDEGGFSEGQSNI